jgi:hypothetical protein
MRRGGADRAESIMALRVSGKNIDLGEALRGRISARVSRKRPPSISTAAIPAM